MTCHDVAAAIVDEGLPRPVGFQAHLDQCPRCRELARLHASASKLRLASPPALAPIPRQAVLGEVRRRHHRRRALAGVAVTGAVAAVALLVMPPRVQPVPASEMVTQAELVSEVEPASIGLLIDEVESYTRRNPSVRDETYAPFGALALWVRPPDTVALEDRPFRTAIAPLHASPTQEPAR
ncbi:hypothetical protein [Hyalangium rubrum]|uniref:Zinc-finger domain-containing protein n=1 Tax=Hyalangium rubrum TaxID=3103134 RepID=A0ABU5HFB2_9BACT|nr:hypothetical protein [Hyalangium sp. s54d21]MDY7230755.1 hypothetical protein [Hyalangium sp. s54d21]